MMEFELTDIATVAFIAYGITYQGVKYWRSERKFRLKRELPVSLTLRGVAPPAGCSRAVVILFDRRGC